MTVIVHPQVTEIEIRSIAQTGPPGPQGPPGMNAGGVHVAQTTIDFGAVPVASAVFTVFDVNVSPTSVVTASLAWQQPPGKEVDDMEMEPLVFGCTPGSGFFTMYAASVDGCYVHDQFVVNYLVG